MLQNIEKSGEQDEERSEECQPEIILIADAMNPPSTFYGRKQSKNKTCK